MKFIQVLVDGTVNVIEKEQSTEFKYWDLLKYLHPDYWDREHPTSIRDDIWMVEDDSYQYVLDDEWSKYTNEFARKVDCHGESCVGPFVIFKVGDRFRTIEDLNDVLDFTDSDIELIKQTLQS